MVKTKINSNFDGLKKILAQVNSNSRQSKPLGYFVSSSVHKHYTPAMPMNTGAFSQVIQFEPWKYTHMEDYSVYVNNINMNFRKDKHPYAMAHYIEGFESVARPKIEKEVAEFIKVKVIN